MQSFLLALVVLVREGNAFSAPAFHSNHHQKIRSLSTPLRAFTNSRESSSSTKSKRPASTVQLDLSSRTEERDDSSLLSATKPLWEQGKKAASSKIFSPSASSSSSTEQQQSEPNNALLTNDQTREFDVKQVLAVVAALVGAAGVGTAVQNQESLPEMLAVVQSFFANPQATLQGVLDTVQAMGPFGMVYFGILYTIAEVLAVPATPLTLSAGYLFGMTNGALVVLTSATIAASIAFVVGKTFLRTWVEGILEENPKFAKLDKAVGEQGFKLLVLIRLSPIFPFALSNYLYGASAISFPAYFWGTLIGFAPGTLAYVYTGMVGKELMLGDGSAQPWYIYAAGFVALGTFLKLVSDVAGGIVEAIEDDDDAENVSAPSP